MSDRTYESGNDYAMVQELGTMTSTKVVKVENLDEVLENLKEKV